MIELKLTNANGTKTLQLPEAPLTRNVVEGAVDVVTMDNDMSTYFTANKRQWVHTWAYMTKQDLLDLWDIYEQQFVDFQYPKLSITGVERPVTNVKVRMYLPSQSIIDDCETYGGVQVTWREA